MGGDSNADNANVKNIWNTIGNEINHVVGSDQLITYHPSGGASSAQWFNDAEWLDFHTIQSGHCYDIYDANKLLIDSRQATNKPILDSEPRYEEIVRCFSQENDGSRIPVDEVREIAYRQIFSGAFGHTYGHQSIWKLDVDSRNDPVGGEAEESWKKSLNDDGAVYMKHLSKLMRSRPLLNRVPDQSIVLNDDEVRATKGDGYVFVYLPKGGSVTVQLGKISGSHVKAWWYNPKTGQATEIGTYENSGTQVFPSGSDDMVLVLDDTSKSYVTPGN